MAVDGNNGVIYVTQPSSKAIERFHLDGTSAGSPITSFRNSSTSVTFKTPISVGVDNSGHVYVGDKSLYNVSIGTPDGTLIGVLGKGTGEFVLPSDVAVASNNYVYVSDSKCNWVKVYAPDGNGNYPLKFYFGGNSSAPVTYTGSNPPACGSYGSGPGQMHFPTGIFSDDLNQEIYVVDQMNYRVQVFDRSGSYMRAFSGFTTGQGISVANGKVFVADSYQDEIAVFDTAGACFNNPSAPCAKDSDCIGDTCSNTFVGLVGQYNGPACINGSLNEGSLYGPTGVRVIGDTVYVVNMSYGQVVEFGIVNPQGLSLSPSTLSFSTPAGFNPPQRTIQVDPKVAGNAPAWTATTSGPFGMTIDPSSGYAPVSVAVAVDATGLTQGTYTGVVTFHANGVDYPVVVNLTVSAPCLIDVGPPSLAAGTVGTEYGPVSFTQNGSGTITWSGSGTLPTGMSFANGVLSGTPTQTGSFNITVGVTDQQNGCTGSRSYNFNVNCPTISLPATLPNGTIGALYNQSVSASGGNAPYTYSVSGGSLPAGLSLDPATGAILGTPATIGSSTFTVTVSDNFGCSSSQQYTVAVGCPVMTLGPVSLLTGIKGSSYDQTIIASGGVSLYTYALTSGSLPSGVTLSSGGNLSGTPTETGDFNITVTATDSKGCSGDRAYTLHITLGRPVINVAPISPVDFGSVNVGSSSGAQTLTVTNTGDMGLVIQTITSDGAEFSISNDNCSSHTIAANGGSCTLQVTFKPATFGASSATLWIPSNDPDTPFSMTMNGTGEAAKINVTPASPVGFGSVNVGSSSAAQTFTVSNTGNIGLVIGTITSSNPEFAITNDNCSNQTIAAGSGSCTLQVSYTPVTYGASGDATLSIPSNDPKALTFSIAMNGIGEASNIDVSPASPVGFGSVNVGSSSTAQTFTVSNTGNIGLVIDTITSSNPEFAISNDNCSNHTVAANGGSCTLQVTFTPATYGTRSSELHVFSNDPDTHIFSISMNGMGEASNIEVSPAPPASFGSVNVGSSSAPQTFTVSNTGNIGLVIDTITSSNPEFAISNDNCSNQTIAANGGTCTLQVTFTPVAYGASGAALSIPSNAPKTPTFSIAMNGIGEASSINVNPASPVDFGSVNVGSSSAQTFTVSNTGNIGLVIGTITSSSPDFAISNDNCSNQTIAADSGSCTFQVTFAPAAYGVRKADIGIPSNDALRTSLTMSLTGTGSGTDTLPPTGSITINNGATYTNNRSVTLTLSAKDPSGVSKMCISNVNTASSCLTAKAWVPFAATTAWTLTYGDGPKTVYVWFMDAAGIKNVAPYSDSIILDKTAPTNGVVTAKPGNAQVALSWSAFVDRLSGIASYKVVYAVGKIVSSCSTGTPVPGYDGVSTSYIHTGLVSGAKYYYRVCAVDNAGNVSTGATTAAVPY